MSIIEAERKRLQDFLAEQTAAHEASKKRAREHCDNAVALADFAIQTLKDHVAEQIAALEAADANARRRPPAARPPAAPPRLAHGPG